MNASQTALNCSLRDSEQRGGKLGEFATQKAIDQMALAQPPQRPVLLFEDHRIASANFYLPNDCPGSLTACGALKPGRLHLNMHHT